MYVEVLQAVELSSFFLFLSFFFFPNLGEGSYHNNGKVHNTLCNGMVHWVDYQRVWRTDAQDLNTRESSNKYDELTRIWSSNHIHYYECIPI